MTDTNPLADRTAEIRVLLADAGELNNADTNNLAFLLERLDAALARVEELERQLAEKQRQLDLTVNQMHQANASALRELQADERAEDLQRQLDALGEGDEEWAVRVFTRADQSHWFCQDARAESFEADLASTISVAADSYEMGTREAPINHGFAVVKRTVWSSEWETVKTVAATGKPTVAPEPLRAPDSEMDPFEAADDIHRRWGS